MRSLITSILLLTFTAVACASGSYIGQFLFNYEGGSVYRVILKDAMSLSRECIKGPEKGAQGIENPERFKVADKIYFSSWVEKTGIQVSRVINLNTLKVYSTIIEGEERYVVTGNIVSEK
ncbi:MULTISPECIES: MoaF C-terminal domain-containing protein [unclassified Methylophilus]|uniref:MoaF-related domain-containing protein n=1 Tax=unclassified Methylophilus TaxID=2630143 RepID=UPI000AD6B1F6|nr:MULTISPECIES: MoaF C-terminal domain-containing protein [unclassified Methylophilus]